jgi:phage tail tape-measure protein
MLIGGTLGEIGGGAAGHELAGALGLGDVGTAAFSAIGSVLGGALGALLPFRTGGGIKGSRRNAHLVIVHGGEHIIPANAHITKEQSQVIRSNKLKKRHGSSVYNR